MGTGRPPKRLPRQSAAAEADRYVFRQRLRCPVCQQSALGTNRTDENSYELVSRRTVCRMCGHRFIAIFDDDAPDFGVQLPPAGTTPGMTPEFLSVGRLSVELQADVHAVRSAIVELKLPPAAMLDHRPFYPAAVVEQLKLVLDPPPETGDAEA